MSFVHLHTHSHYSLLDGLAKIPELVRRAKELGMHALALTDHGNLYGAIEFYKTCKKFGVKPIIGVEVYVAARSLHEKSPGIDDKRFHLILLVKNIAGYKNLVKLVTIAHLEGFYYKPRIDKQILARHRDGLVALSGCMSGEIPRALFTNNKKRAEELVAEYRTIFKDDFYIEIGHHPGIPGHADLHKKLIAFAEKHKIPLVATHDIHYLLPKDARAQDVLLAVQTNTRIDDEDRLTMKDDDFSMRSPEEMRSFFSHIPEAIDNTLVVAEKCNLELTLGHFQLPHFILPPQETMVSYLTKLCGKGLIKRYGNNPSDDVKKRLSYELGVIEKMGFIEYFLVIWDVVNWAKNQKIVVGPGRGSAPGSLVSYVLEITDVDPIKYNLIFERFLNPERVEPPDIDLDFADTGRDAVIEYVTQKYGEDHVAQIVTFGTMAARAAIRDAGRALGINLALADQTAKMIPFNPNQGEKEGYLAKCLNNVPELKTLYETNMDAQRMIDAAKKLEGVARHASVHASGVVISREPLVETVPLQRTIVRQDNASARHESGVRQEAIVAQYDMHSILAVGLLKMDFLGLKNLSIIESALRLVKERHGVEIRIDQLDINDPKPYRMLGEGKTVGVFQLEGSGMTRYLKELEPTNIEDIIAMIALFRPGPMELIPSFIARKLGKEKVAYRHPLLEQILAPTYGIAVYQEQVMQIARDLGGFSMAEADILRKAIGKKIRKLLEEQKEKFIAGMLNNNIPEHVAIELGEVLEPFARYGFNKAHAASYAILGFQTAYLKYYYPLEFMVSLFNADRKDNERIAFLIKECQSMKLEVLPPTINASEQEFAAEKNSKTAIRFGLVSIKNVGAGVVDTVIEERTTNGPYTSLTNFLERVASRDLNKKSIEALAKAGALDELGERNSILLNMDKILEYAKSMKTARAQRQENLFDLMPNSASLPPLRMKQAPPATILEKLSWERELLGLYVSGHPLDRFGKAGEGNDRTTIERIKTVHSDQMLTLYAVVAQTRKIITKKGEQMIFARLQDQTDEIEAVAFPGTYQEYGQLLADNACIALQGRFNERNGAPSFIVERVKLL